MASIAEMAANIVAAHASTTPLTKEQILDELREVCEVLSRIEKGQSAATSAPEEQETTTEPAITKRKAFGKSKITCMICGKEMKTLARHLKTAHGMTAKEYRDQFDIPRTQPLAAKAYSETRKQMAIDNKLGDNLAKARAARGKGKKKPAA